jgi:hypothetical protein
MYDTFIILTGTLNMAIFLTKKAHTNPTLTPYK